MLHIAPISLPSKSKDMEYSEDFKNMVKAHQGKFIGYGNPNARVLIIVPKLDDERLVNYNEKNAEQWLANIENQKDFDDVIDFFINGEQVGNESTFNPLYPFKGQRDILRKDKERNVVNVDGTCVSWHRLQFFLDEMQWDITDKIDFFKYAFYTIFDEDLLKDIYFQQHKFIIYTFSNEKEFALQNPVQLFDMKFWGGQIKPSRAQRIAMYESRTTDREMMVTISFEKASKIIQKKIKCQIEIAVHRTWSNIGVSDDSYIKSYVDKIAGGEIKDFSQKKKMCNRIIRTINGNVADDPYRWVDTWMYTFQKLKGDPSFLLLDSTYRYHHICELLTVLFVAAPHEAVREIAAYIIESNQEYWYILSHIFHYCYNYRVASIMRNVEKPYLSKNTYEDLMEVIKGIKSVEKRTIVMGKLLWLKHLYRSIYGKKLGY